MKLKLKKLGLRFAAAAAALSLLVSGAAAQTLPESAENGAGHMAAAEEKADRGIGVNFNQNLETVVFEDMKDTGTTWARGFVPYFVFKDGAADGTVDINTDARILNIKRLKQEGYKTIVSLKFNYTGKHFPTTMAGYDEELSYLDALLDAVYPYADIIVSGNEPFIESIPEERNATLINYYKEITGRIHEYSLKQDRQVPIYIGALNQMWSSTFMDAYHQSDYLSYAKQTPWIAGVDLHIHHANMAQFDTSMDSVSKLLRDDQRIIVTEFSPVQYWKSHTSETMPKIMADKYGYNPTWKVYQYLNHATKNRDTITIGEWEDFLSACKWYTDMQDYLLDAYNRFILNDKFYVATYGMYIFFNAEEKTFGPDNDPWLLNPLYATSTVQKDKDGRYQENYKMLKNFQLIQEMTKSDKTYITGSIKSTAVEVNVGTDLASVISQMPKAIKVSTNKGVISVDVFKWECDDYNPNKAGTYTFKAAETAADSFENPQGFDLTVSVVVAPEITFDDIILPEPAKTDVWYKFDEPAGSKEATDCVSNIKTTVFEAEFAPGGVSGGCVSFDGAGQKIQLGSNGAGSSYFNKGYSARTISFWFNPEKIDGKQMLVETGGNIAGMGVRINDGVLQAAVNSNVIGNLPLTTGFINRWNHVALSYNKGACKFYVNGKLVASRSISDTKINDPANPSDIACNVNKSNAFDDNRDTEQYYAGKLDELRFYASAVEVKAANNAPGDKAPLNAAIASAKSLDQALYTEESLEAFNAALSQAQRVLENDNATQDDVDNALEALTAAVKALIKKPETSDPNPPQPSVKNGFIKGADGKSYYWKDNAKVANAWVVSGGKTYRTDLSGAMITGTRVIKTGGKSYIIVNSVRAQGSAWVKCGKKTYRIKSGAVMSGKKAKRIKVGKKYYILDKSGARVQSKVVKVGKKLYYAAKSGAIKKNAWIKYKGKSYYALKSGSLAAGKAIKIKGKKYTFAKNGVCKSKK